MARLFSVIGTPSASSHVGCFLVRKIADAVFGSHAFISAASIEDIKRAWTDIDFSVSKALVLYSDLPSKSLAELITANRAPTVIFVDEFESMFRFMKETHNAGTMEALRVASQAVCSVGLISGTNILSIRSSVLKRKLNNVVLDLCEFYRIEDPRSFTETLLERIGADPQSAFSDFVSQQKLTLIPSSGVTQSMADDLKFSAKYLALQYAKVNIDLPRPEISWPTSLFLNATRPGENIEGQIDLVGPARFVIYGPYMHLPPGDWLVTIVIEITENISRNRLLVDIASGGVLTEVIARLPASGLFDFEMQCRIDNPYIPVEVRFQIMEGAIEGRLGLREVVFRPVRDASE